MRQVRQERIKQKFNNHVYMGEIQGNWVNPPNGWRPHFKYHLQLTAKEDVENSGRGFQRGGRWLTWKWWTNVCWALLRQRATERNFNGQTLLGSSLSTHLVDTIVAYGDNSLSGTSPLSRQLGGSQNFFLSLLGRECFQLKIIHMPKWYILEWHIFLPYNT